MSTSLAEDAALRWDEWEASSAHTPEDVASSAVPAAPVPVEAVLEAVLLTSTEPVSRAQIVKAFADAKSPCRPLSAEEIAAAVIHLTRRCTQTTSALALLQTRSGLQLRTDPRLEPWLRHFHRKIRRVRLSRAALETLAIVAYRQPVSTPDVEQIRGVSSAQVLRSLMEKDLVHIVGRSGSVGRALLYGTTPSFLDHLGLRHLGQLPRREELAAMWGGTDGAAAAGAVDTEQDGS